jgi:UDP-N-acetylmuramate dehydrogenase
MAIDSVADYLVEIESVDEFSQVLELAKQKNLPIKVLGGGSNVIMADAVSGLVLRYVGCRVEVVKEDQESVQVRVEAGLNWHQFVLMSLDNGWNGLENLSYIPGHVGACPVQNIGAYGVEVKDLIDTVEGVYIDSGESFSLSNAQCEFAYRESVFKQALNGKTLISHVTFKLSKLNDVNVAYAPLNQMAEEQGVPTPKQLSEWVISVRQSKLPDPADLPNAGSFFKNPVVSQAQFEELDSRYENMPSYANDAGVKLPAGWLIDKLGLKGHSFGSVSVHKRQALVLVNQGGTGKDVLSAAEDIKQRVKVEYGVRLEQEPRLFD